MILELGGKSANIILPDADLSRAVPNVVVNMTAQAGQGCSLLTRTLVHESLFDELVGRVKTALDAVATAGDPANPATTMGPLISAAQRAKVEGLIQAGRDEGAQIAYGGGRPAGLDRGFFVEPTLFVDVDNSMTDRPAGVLRPGRRGDPVQGEQEAVRLANDSEFGLAAGVWAADPVQAYRIGTRIRAGLVYINGGGAGPQPAHPVRRLQEQRPRRRAGRVRPGGVPADQEHDLECPLGGWWGGVARRGLTMGGYVCWGEEGSGFGVRGEGGWGGGGAASLVGTRHRECRRAEASPLAGIPRQDARLPVLHGPLQALAPADRGWAGDARAQGRARRAARPGPVVVVDEYRLDADERAQVSDPVLALQRLVARPVDGRAGTVAAASEGAMNARRSSWWTSALTQS